MSSKLPFNIVSHTKTKQNNGNIHDTTIQNINIESRTEYSDINNIKENCTQMWLFVQEMPHNCKAITNIFELCVEFYLIVSIYDFSLKCYVRIWAICMHVCVMWQFLWQWFCAYVCVYMLGVWLWALCVSNSPAGVDPTTHFPILTVVICCFAGCHW